MPKFKDLTGMKFDKLTVLKQSDISAYNKTTWHCICECGNTRDIVTYQLTSGIAKSCGCHKIENIKGQRFGKWTVLELTDNKASNGQYLWKCQCDCGMIREIPSSRLKNGDSKSCGCVEKGYDLTGQRFGKLVALHRSENQKDSFVMWTCQCDCGNLYDVRSRNLIIGATKSCGCNFIKDLVGQRFGRLVVIKKSENKNKHNQTMWNCLCDC